MKGRETAGGWEEFGRAEQDRAQRCEVCEKPIGKRGIKRRYCSSACGVRAVRKRGWGKTLTGGSKRFGYSTIASGQNESGQLYTVVGWGRSKGEAKAHATAQLEQAGYEPVCYSTPDSIYRDLQRTK